jgi:hypothetical protein
MPVEIKNYMFATIPKAEVYALLKAQYSVPAFYTLEEFGDDINSTNFLLKFRDTR